MLLCIVGGGQTKTFCAQTGVSLKTAEAHRYNLLTKLEAHGIAQLISIALQTGLASLGDLSPLPEDYEVALEKNEDEDEAKLNG